MADNEEGMIGSSDPEASRDVDSVADLLRLAGRRPAVPPERTERAKTSLRDVWRETLRARSLRRRLQFLAAAAALAAGSWLALWRGRTPATPGSPIATVAAVSGSVRPVAGGSVPIAPGAILRPSAEIETGRESRVALRLAGGQSVRLDFATRLRLDSASSLVLERGAVYVDSGASTAAGIRPGIEVRTPIGVARDVGTQFEMRLVGRNLRLRVREGRVVLDPGRGPLEALSGTEIDVEARGVSRRAGLRPGGPEWNWVLRIAPPYSIDGRPLGEVLAWVSRETGVPIRFADADLSKRSSAIVLHGSIAAVPPDELLAAVLPTCGLEERFENGTAVIAPAESRSNLR